MSSNLQYQHTHNGRQNNNVIIITGGHDSSDEERLFIKENTPLNRPGSKRFTRSSNKDVKRKVRRLIKKSGKSTLIRSTIPFRRYRYFLDLGNTLVNSRWRWTLIFLASSFIVSWLLFAFFWMLISNSNGDFDEENPSETPCLTGINGFPGFFLFSIETQATIGYGSRYINHYCPEGTFLMALQIIMGSAICGGMVSIVYVKMARPLTLQCKRLFSNNAVICQRDGVLCVIFRVRDEDNRHIVGTSIDAYIVENREHEPVLYTIALDPPGILMWPLEVVHKITPESPFWDFSAKDLIYKKFELIVTMQGTSVTTGQCSKTRTSYLSTEILWGRRFKPCVKFDNEKRAYYIDHSQFNETEEVLTPLCSAQRMEEVLAEIQSPVQLPRRTSIFTFDNIIGGGETNRLQERRSTVVLTEINKSTEILDTSDSEEEVASPEILISHSDNIPIPSLDYNAKTNSSGYDEEGEPQNSNAENTGDYNVSVDHPDSVSVELERRKSIKRKISFGAKNNITQYTVGVPISQSEVENYSKSCDIHASSTSIPPMQETYHLNAPMPDMQVSSCSALNNIRNTPAKDLIEQSSLNSSAQSLPNLPTSFIASPNLDQLQKFANHVDSIEITKHPSKVSCTNQSDTSDQIAPNKIDSTIPNALGTPQDKKPPIPNQRLYGKPLPSIEVEDPQYFNNRKQHISEPQDNEPSIEFRQRNKPQIALPNSDENSPSLLSPDEGYRSTTPSAFQGELDEGIFSYLNDIKTKVLTPTPEQPSSKRHSQNCSDMVDIEQLIADLEQYVSQNI